LTVHPEPTAVAALSEAELLARIFPRLSMGGSHSQATLLGPGDDAAVVAAPDGKTVISIDTQVQDQDFRLEWPNGYRTTGFDVGWKAAAQNLSDINAMGATATSLVVSLTLPPGTPVSWVEDLADGLTAGTRELGATRCSVAGGDLGRGRQSYSAPWTAATPCCGPGQSRGMSWRWPVGPDMLLPAWPSWSRP
jgi:thiamine-monophosphate kinase